MHDTFARVCLEAFAQCRIDHNSLNGSRKLCRIVRFGYQSVDSVFD